MTAWLLLHGHIIIITKKDTQRRVPTIEPNQPRIPAQHIILKPARFWAGLFWSPPFCRKAQMVQRHCEKREKAQWFTNKFLRRSNLLIMSMGTIGRLLRSSHPIAIGWRGSIMIFRCPAPPTSSN